MKRTYWLIAMIAILAMAALACASGDGESSDPNILFEDDFSSTSSGWDQYSDERGSTDYADGQYRINLITDTFLFWANPRKDFTDVIIEVDATKVGGEDDNQFGIICRHLDVDNFYVLVISSDGYFGIRKRFQGSSELIFLGMEGMDYSDAINQGNDTNRIKAECVGTRLTLFANGTQLFEVQDADIASGDVGLLAGTFGATSTDVLFDNFVVRKP